MSILHRRKDITTWNCFSNVISYDICYLRANTLVFTNLRTFTFSLSALFSFQIDFFEMTIEEDLLSVTGSGFFTLNKSTLTKVSIFGRRGATGVLNAQYPK